MRWKLVAVPLLCVLSIPSQMVSLPGKESLSYQIEWRLFNAGRAKIDLSTLAGPRAGHEIKLRLESTGIVSKLFKVEDEYTSNLAAGYCAASAQMQIHEGSRLREANVTFDPETKRASYLERDKTKNNAVILSKVAASPADYVGLLGSKRKKAVITKALLTAGLPQAALDRVKVPVGLDIGAVTAEEIAVSVVAELIAWRRQSTV